MELVYKMKNKGNGLFKKTAVLKEDTVEGPKAVKIYAKETLTVEVDGVTYQADTTSLIYLASVVATANARFNLAIAGGATAEQAKQVYDTEISWKVADNTIVSIPISKLVDVTELTLGEIANVIGV